MKLILTLWVMVLHLGLAQGLCQQNIDYSKSTVYTEKEVPNINAYLDYLATKNGKKEGKKLLESWLKNPASLSAGQTLLAMLYSTTCDGYAISLSSELKAAKGLIENEKYAEAKAALASILQDNPFFLRANLVIGDLYLKLEDKGKFEYYAMRTQSIIKASKRFGEGKSKKEAIISIYTEDIYFIMFALQKAKEFVSQALLSEGNERFDLMKFKLADDTEDSLYFNVTAKFRMGYSKMLKD
jgi:hypothetical protein